MLCVFTVEADNNLPSTLWPRSLLNEAHDVSLFCEYTLCASYSPYNSSLIFLLPDQGSVMVLPYPKVKHKLLFVLSDTMLQCSDKRLQLLLGQKKWSEDLIAKENLMYHL